MAQKFLTALNLTQQELQNARLQNLAAAPGSPVEGQMYYNTVSKAAFIYNGTTWVEMDGAGAPVTSVAANDSTVTISPTTGAVKVAVAKALDHTWITDFDTQVHTSRVDQMATPNVDVAWGTNKITGVKDPTAAQDAATKGYVDSVAQGLTPKSAAQVGTTGVLPFGPAAYANGVLGVGATLTAASNGALGSIDGYAVLVGDRILVKNEAAPANNGIYTATGLGSGGTKYVLTRAVDADLAAEIPAAALLVQNGTINANQGWVVDSQGPYTMGTTAITFTQFSGVADVTAGTGLAKSGNSLLIDTAWPGQAAITTVGTIAAGTWNGAAVDIGHGGTGQTSAAAALAALGGTTKYSVLIGDGVSTSITVTHNLGTRDVIVAIYDAATFAVVETDVAMTTVNTLTVAFGAAPASNAYKVVVIG